MSNNDFFIITYKILSYLKYCYEHDKAVDSNILSAGTFNISQSQFCKTLKMLIDQDLINGVSIQVTGDGLYVLNNLNRAAVTMSGLEYLRSDNSMKDAQAQLGSIQNWLPIVK